MFLRSLLCSGQVIVDENPEQGGDSAQSRSRCVSEWTIALSLCFDLSFALLIWILPAIQTFCLGETCPLYVGRFVPLLLMAILYVLLSLPLLFFMNRYVS